MPVTMAAAAISRKQFSAPRAEPSGKENVVALGT
jgi:hypothetical protein